MLNGVADREAALVSGTALGGPLRPSLRHSLSLEINPHTLRAVGNVSPAVCGAAPSSWRFLATNCPETGDRKGSYGLVALMRCNERKPQCS